MFKLGGDVVVYGFGVGVEVDCGDFDYCVVVVGILVGVKLEVCNYVDDYDGDVDY